jgi:hypothetical protein
MSFFLAVRPKSEGHPRFLVKGCCGMDKSGKNKGYMWVLLLVVIGVIFFVWLSSQSNSSTNGGSTQYSDSQYNSDLAKLERILSKAQDLDHRLDAMNPDSFTSQSQVDEYNDLVNQYNNAADDYRETARWFADKYGMRIDGLGNIPTDPDNIQLPGRR